MVLSRVLCAMLVIATITAGIAGCGQSLFDAYGDRRDGGGGGGDDAMVAPDTCEEPCLADAASAFIDTAGTAWRYLDDRRNLVWVPMVKSDNAMMSVNLSNRIARCSDEPSAAACKALPGALLVSSAGMQSAGDPAIEFRSDSMQVIQLVFHAHVPSGSPPHKVRLYRNSREDVLVTAIVEPGKTEKHAVTVDALPNDRFTVALEPTATPGGPVALQFFIRGPVGSFPSTCQFAVPFTVPGSSGTSLGNLCGGEILAMKDAASTQPLLSGGPFGQQGMAGYFEPKDYYKGTEVLATGSAMTVQFWVLNDYPPEPLMWLFSNVDQDQGGGLAIRFTNAGSAPKIEALVLTQTPQLVYSGPSVDYPNPGTWHFVRVVHANGMINFCLDGTRLASEALPGPTSSRRPPYLGRNVDWDLINYLRGEIDDVRVFSTALPCTP